MTKTVGSPSGSMIQAGWGAEATREGAGTDAEGGEVGLAASFSEPSFFSPVVLSEFRSAPVGFSLSE